MGHPAGDYRVDTSRCIRCGVSSSIAPDLVALADDVAVVIRQPETDDERRELERARVLCPAGAIVLDEAEVRV